MTNFIKSLELDGLDLDGKYISVFEEHGGEGNFSLNCFISECLSDSKNALCLLALHHGFEHYFHTGLKLGHNIQTHSDRIAFLEATKIFIRDSQPAGLEFMENLSSDENLKSLLDLLKTTCEALREKHRRVYLIIDNLTNLHHLGTSEKSIKIFAHYLKTLLKDNIVLITLYQYSPDDREQTTVKSFLYQISDITLQISPLQTGLAKDVNGTISVTKRCEGFERKTDFYHYKTTDRNVKIFPPGNI